MLLGVLREEGEVGLKATHIAAKGQRKSGGWRRGCCSLAVLGRRLLLLLAVLLGVGRGPNVASLALLVQVHDLLDEQLVDLEQRVDALLLAGMGDGRDGRLGERLDGRVGGHGLRGRGLAGGWVHGLAGGGGGGGQAGGLGLPGGGIGRCVAVVLAGGGRCGLAVLDELLVGGRREGLREGRGRVRARLALLLLLLLLLLVLLQGGGFMAVSGRRRGVTAWGTASGTGIA